MEILSSNWVGFYEVLYLGIFRNFYKENSSFIKI